MKGSKEESATLTPIDHEVALKKLNDIIQSSDPNKKHEQLIKSLPSFNKRPKNAEEGKHLMGSHSLGKHYESKIFNDNATTLRNNLVGDQPKDIDTEHIEVEHKTKGQKYREMAERGMQK